MMTMKLRTIFVACVLTVVSAQVPSWGKCPDIKLKATFDIKRYLGDWYDVQHFFAIFQSGQDCVKATYSLKENGHINVYNRGVVTKTGQMKNATGDGYVPDPNFPSKLGVRFFDLQPYAPYWIVDTDYDSYSLVYACTNILGLAKTEFVWILSRKPTLDDETVQKLYRILTDSGVDPSHFKVTKQQGCPPL